MPWMRAAAAMFSFTTRWMPQAAAVTSSPSGCATVEAHAAAEEELGVEIAEQQVGVGDGGLAAPEVVAGGPGIGARAVGADLQQAHAVHARNRAAAGSDLDH